MKHLEKAAANKCVETFSTMSQTYAIATSKRSERKQIQWRGILAEYQ